MKSANRSRWVFVLDYNADPDVDSESVRLSLEDELGAAKGSPVIVGEKVILDRTDDAFSLKMRFSNNIVRVEKYDFNRVVVIA